MVLSGTPGRPPGLGALAVLGVLLLALTLGGLALHLPGADSVGSVARTNLFVALMALAGLVYLLSVGLVLRASGERGQIWLVLAIAIGLRGAVLTAPPFLSSDLYRYVWDGRVQLAGINPYRYIPTDPALAPLRDHVIFDHVNRRSYAPTIYPPAAQLAFRLIVAIGQTPLVAKLAAVFWEGVGVACLVGTLRLCGQPTARVLLYAWNPLAVWSYAGNGHVDAEAIGFLSAALLARAAGRDGWAGVALGAAFLVKFLPAAIAPALWRWRWRLPAAAAVTVALLYAPFLGVGPRHVLGFLGAYGGEEGLRDGSGIWLLAGLGDLVRLPQGSVTIYVAVVALALGAAAFAVAWPRRPLPPDVAADVARVAGHAGFLAALTMLLLSPHYPWYFPFLAIFAVLRPSRALLWMSVAPLVLYLTPWHEFFFWPSLVYAPALIIFVLDEWPRVTRSPVPHTRERSVP